MHTDYYVYEYLREDGTPYYVGKGRCGRYKERHNVPIPPEDRIKFVARNLNDNDAKSLEKELILKYGRKDIGTGILRNLTEVGEGDIPGPESRKRMSEAKKNYIPWNKGKTNVQYYGPEHRKKISEAALKRWSKKIKKEKESIECLQCKQTTTNKKFCSNSCRGSYYKFQTLTDGKNRKHSF
jgi:hypothetical protein